MSRYAEILVGGSGGQGLIFMASFFAEAAMAEGLNVVQTQSYGIAQRGGFVSAEIIMSSEEILFQQVSKPSIAIALHEAVGTRFDTLDIPVVYDSGIMAKKEHPNWYGLPFSSLAKEAGFPKSANLIAIGAALHFAPVLSMQAIEKAAQQKFKAEIAKANCTAVSLGLEQALKNWGKRG